MEKRAFWWETGEIGGKNKKYFVMDMVTGEIGVHN